MISSSSMGGGGNGLGGKRVKSSNNKAAGACRPSSKNCGYNSKSKPPKRGGMPKPNKR